MKALVGLFCSLGLFCSPGLLCSPGRVCGTCGNGPLDSGVVELSVRPLATAKTFSSFLIAGECESVDRPPAVSATSSFRIFESISFCTALLLSSCAASLSKVTLRAACSCSAA